MFGRPLCIASHHFDTQLPSYCDPAIDKTGRLYLPNIALFKLAYVLGDIMDDAVSVRPVPYENVQANDRALVQWMENLPQELDLDEYRVARNLASPNTAMRRQGVQSIIIRTSFYHIRFTLHRPYAAHAHGSPSRALGIDAQKAAESLEIAVGAADKLITMVGQSRPDFLANSSLAVPGHMNWGPFHCFSAAMFFSFQLIANPEQPGAGLFRASVRKAMGTLEQARGSAVADKGYDILQAITPLYSGELNHLNPEEKVKRRSQVFSVIRKLAFPYHDSHGPRRYGESSSGRGSADSPATSSVSPPMPMVSIPTSISRPYDGMSNHTPALHNTPQTGYDTHMPSSMPSLNQSPALQLSPSMVSNHTTTPYQAEHPYILAQQQQIYGENSRYSSYVHPVDDSSMWGAAVGFGQGEWSQFIDGMGAVPSSSSRHLHSQGS